MLTTCATAIALLLGAAGVAQTPPSQVAAAAPAGNAEAGKLLFMKIGCADCHGREGQGAPISGPRIAPGPLPFVGFARYVRAPRLQMPPYTAKVVSDQDLADIHAYLRSRPRPPAVDTVLPK